MKIVTVTGYKGGVGKSTTAIHLATYLSERGQVVLVDGDANRTALSFAERGALPFEVADQRSAMRVVSGADFVVIDTPARPASDDLEELARGCDLLILPTVPDVVSLEPMLAAAAALGDRVTYRALITINPPHPSREGELMREDLREAGISVFDTLIPRTVAFAKAALSGKPVSSLDDPRARAAWDAYRALGSEVMEVFK